MRAIYSVPARADAPEVAPVEINEPSCIASTYVDGLSALRVDKAGVDRLNLFAKQIDADGEMSHILVERLVMSREVLREIADRMLTASMLDEHRAAVMRKRMT